MNDASDAKDALKKVQAILGESSAILGDLPPEPGRITPATFEEADFNIWLGHEPKNQVQSKLISEPERHAAYTREYLGWGVFALMPRLCLKQA